MGRIKLFYTVEEDAVLAEAAKIINLGAEDMQHAVKLFSQCQGVLKGENSDGAPVNITLALEMIDEYRQVLLNVDTRLEEVAAIVKGYESYKLRSRDADRDSSTSSPAAPEVKAEGNE